MEGVLQRAMPSVVERHYLSADCAFARARKAYSALAMRDSHLIMIINAPVVNKCGGFSSVGRASD